MWIYFPSTLPPPVLCLFFLPRHNTANSNQALIGMVTKRAPRLSVCVRVFFYLMLCSVFVLSFGWVFARGGWFFSVVFVFLSLVFVRFFALKRNKKQGRELGNKARACSVTAVVSCAVRDGCGVRYLRVYYSCTACVCVPRARLPFFVLFCALSIYDRLFFDWSFSFCFVLFIIL